MFAIAPLTSDLAPDPSKMKLNFEEPIFIDSYLGSIEYSNYKPARLVGVVNFKSQPVVSSV